MLYLGLDLSLNASGVSLIDEGYTILKQIVISEGAKGAERLFLNERTLNEFILPYQEDIKLVTIESSALKAEGHIVDIAMWAGCAVLLLYKIGIPVIWAAPSQIKKFASGKYDKNASKGVIIKNVYKNFGEDFDDDNLCDAYIAARIAHDFNEVIINKNITQRELTIAQMSVLKKINETYSKEREGHLLK